LISGDQNNIEYTKWDEAVNKRQLRKLQVFSMRLGWPSEKELSETES
jgi:hypothetical protein